MAVSTLEHDALAVDEDASVAVLYLAEAVLLRIDVAADTDVDGVEVRRLGCPQLGVLHFEVKLSRLDAVLYLRDLQDGCLYGLACRVDKLYVDAGVGCFLAHVLQGDVDAEESTAGLPLTIDH